VVAVLSLLDKASQDVILYPAEPFEDDLGNTLLRPSAVGIPAKAEIQAARQSGTSARRAEQDNEGYETEEIYRVRLPRRVTAEVAAVLPLGPGSQLRWDGKLWSFVGYPTPYMGGRRTKHTDYQIRRT
jgi:hypothetical protein